MSPTILVAGGGTGGHVFPGLAVADALRALADVEVVFCGTPRGLEARAIPPRGYRLELLDVAPMKGGGASRMVKGAAIAARETARAISLVRRVRPRAVLSMGGYAAGPVALAAAMSGVPLAVLEPNSTIGFANKILAPFSARAYVAWPEVGDVFRKGRARLLGVPLRAGFVPSPYVPGAHAHVLVLGGSQGAAPLNDRVPEAAHELRARGVSFDVLHQAGRERDRRVRERYASLGVEARVVEFIDDVASEIARADVVVARAGAVTVAELAAVGRACILVPYPHAADDHQTRNARALEQVGGCVCLPQDDALAEAAGRPASFPHTLSARLAGELSSLAQDFERRVRMADAARAHGRPTAAMDVARDLLDLAGIRVRTPAAGGAYRTNGAGGSSSLMEAR